MSAKIGTSHLERRAVVYVRQSSAKQVEENRESTARQYALSERASSLGWTPNAIEVIDEDLGRSGSTAETRTGFGRLAEAVAGGEVGAILALEVSRLARSSQDWQRLLALCSVTGVIVIDEQTVYDPNDGDDKLLLDLKGTMSEAELRWLHLRMAGGRLNKARRGELRLQPPAGYVWGSGGLELDPDEAVQRTIRALFERFAVEPTATAVVKWARAEGLQVPSRKNWADGFSELGWRTLSIARLHQLLHNPLYAGAYVYGRGKTKKVLVDGRVHSVSRQIDDPASWQVVIQGAHPGYITWETYLGNREKLRRNRTQFAPAVPGPPREGRALLTGILICGRCGRRMEARYWKHCWSYRCRGELDRGARICWTTSGVAIDRAVEELFLRTVVPDELELCLAVEREANEQATALGEQWRVRLEQAQYEARRAERRYKAVDPDNRVVARTLEGEWERRLLELEELQHSYDRARKQRRVELSDDDRARIRGLARELTSVWSAPTTTPADRKAMLRLAIEAVTLLPAEVPRRVTHVRVQWQSGAVTALEVDWPKRADARRTPAAAVKRIRELASAGVRDESIAAQLDAEGIQTGAGMQWNVWAVRWARRRNDIKTAAPSLPRRHKLPDQRADGRWSVEGTARRFGVDVLQVRRWIVAGVVSGVREDYEQHRQVWWLEIDDALAAELQGRAARFRPRRRRSAPGSPKEGPASRSRE